MDLERVPSPAMRWRLSEWQGADIDILVALVIAVWVWVWLVA